MELIYNNLRLKRNRKILRKNQTESERLIWSKLRHKQLNGIKFFRQYSVGNYILDFYCPEKRLAIEIDGGQHNEDENIINDQARSKFLKKQDIKVIRFWNNDVLKNMEGVFQKIQENL